MPVFQIHAQIPEYEVLLVQKSKDAVSQVINSFTEPARVYVYTKRHKTTTVLRPSLLISC